MALNTPYNPNGPHYNEKSGGFIDSGWAAKQTYFHYDAEVPVKTELDPARASDRFFADPSYVGEVVEQFYADDSSNPIDEDLAIIEIELGAVAKYPGYYMKVDGFISDEMYIQDGRYYQAFSYVVKVEEELRKYADIVKALVHPSGMKLYSEYTIFNILEVAAVSRKVSRFLQLPVKGAKKSEANTIDIGFGYNNYMTELIDENYQITMPSTVITGNYATYPAPIPNLEFPGSSGIIKSRQNKVALHSGKSISDVVLNSDFKEFLLEKDIRDNFAALDDQYKLVSKNVADSIDQYIETSLKDYTKNSIDDFTVPDFIAKALSTIKSDTQLVLESYNLLVSKQVSDIIESTVDFNVKQITKSIVEEIVVSETTAADYVKSLIDSVLLLDTDTRDYIKSVISSITTSDSNSSIYNKNVNDALPLLESLSQLTEKLVVDAVSVLDDVYKIYSDKKAVDELSITDNSSTETIKQIADSIYQIDLYFSNITKNINEILSIQENVANTIDKATIVESISTSDIISDNLNKIIDDSISIVDIVLIIRTILAEEYITIIDSISNITDKQITDRQEIVDNGILRAIENTKNDIININTIGRIRLSPYDQESYFELYSDYQPATIIT